MKKLQQELESLEGLMEEAENCVGRQKEQLKHLQVKGRPALWVIFQLKPVCTSVLIRLPLL